jgi:hypothetical protein
LRTSVLPGPGSSPFSGMKPCSPLPTPGGHAGVRSTLSMLPQAVRSAAPKSNTAPAIARRNLRKLEPCRTPIYYDVTRQEDVSCLDLVRRLPARGRKRAQVQEVMSQATRTARKVHGSSDDLTSRSPPHLQSAYSRLYSPQAARGGVEEVCEDDEQEGWRLQTVAVS